MPDSRNALKELLRLNRDAVWQEWQRGIMKKQNGAALLAQKEPNRFVDPAACAFQEAMNSIYETLAEGSDLDRHALEYAMKIQAVQTKDVAEGAAFIYLLKDAVRLLFHDLATDELDRQIDGIAEIAKEMFHENRIKIRQLAGQMQP